MSCEGANTSDAPSQLARLRCSKTLTYAFLSKRETARSLRVVCHKTVCDWKDVNRATTQGSVSGLFLFNLFLNDLDVTQYCQDSDLTKYADDTFILVRKNSVDESQKALNAFLEWTEIYGMSRNTSKCKEVCMVKKGVTPNFHPLCGIEQIDSLTLLGVTLQNNCKFSSHVKVFRYSFSEAIPIFFNRFESDFILVWSP